MDPDARGPSSETGGNRLCHIQGTVNPKQELTDQLELTQDARFFAVSEDQMFSKRESEML